MGLLNKIIKRAAVAILSIASFSAAAIDVSDFQAYVDSVIPGSRYGLSVRSVKTGKELVNIRGEERFTPASTLKTLSTATALHFLPLDYAPETKVALNGSLTGKTFTGSIDIRGEGDPNFSGRFYADPFYMLYAMVDSIKSVGVDTIRGRLDLDTTYYTGPWKAEHWRKNFYDAWYGAEIAPLNFNDNCTLIRMKPGAKEGDSAIVTILPDVGYVKVKNELVTSKKRRKKWTWALDPVKPEITIGGDIGVLIDSVSLVLPVRNPIGYFRAAFIYSLQERGITFVEDKKVSQGIVVREFNFSAAPLLSILDEINQRSQNFHAETLFRNLGAEKAGSGSVEGGKTMEGKFLKEIGLDSSDFDVWDGCGLSPKNKVIPSVETKLLEKMARHPKGSYYINSFASPGVGTGGKRMLDFPYPWLTKFKTGFIGEAHALAGYMFPMDGDTLVLAMYLNETGKNPDATCKDVLDTLWTRLMNRTSDGYSSLMQMKDLWLSGRGLRGLAPRLEYFSRALKGRPYLLGAMGESYLDSVDNKPLVNVDSVDCVTYVEHVLAMALSKDEKSIYKTLQKIRYLNGKISFANRKHYFIEDWIGEGKYAKVAPMKGDTTIVRTLPKNDFFKAKKINYGKPDPQTSIRYLPFERALEWAGQPYSGELKVMGVAFIGKSDKIDATHTGFIVLKPGEKPLVRHASSLRKQVIEQPFAEYLESRRGKLPGVTLFEFLEK